MRIATIAVPKGCTEIYVDLEDNQVVVSYASKLNTNEIFCEETGEVEELPGIGDFAIFWAEGEADKACCMNYTKKVGEYYGSSDGLIYKHAIKFRNYEQFLKVRGIYGED